MTKKRKKISVFDFTNYREFLSGYFAEMKEENPGFSYRSFNKRAGIKSSGFLKLVIDGERNLAQEGVYKVSKGLKLGSREAKFFAALVKMNQAKSHDEKEHHYKDLCNLFPSKHPNLISHLHYKIFSHWYSIAILEMVRLDSFKDDPEWIGRRLYPKVERARVAEALKDLEEIGLIKRDESGKWIRSEEMIATPDEVKSLSVVNFHDQMAALARKIVKEKTNADKDFSSLTVAVSKDQFTKIRNMIREFRRKLHSVIEDEEKGKTLVAHINFQLFKLVKEGGTK